MSSTLPCPDSSPDGSPPVLPPRRRDARRPSTPPPSPPLRPPSTLKSPLVNIPPPPPLPPIGFFQPIRAGTGSLKSFDEAEDGSLAWLLQQAVENRSKRMKRAQAQSVLDNSSVAGAIPKMDESVNTEANLSESLRKQCAVVETLRKSLADEFLRLTSSSSSSNDSDDSVVQKVVSATKSSGRGLFMYIKEACLSVYLLVSRDSDESSGWILTKFSIGYPLHPVGSLKKSELSPYGPGLRTERDPDRDPVAAPFAPLRHLCAIF